MVDEREPKDRLGEKLRDKAKAEEEQFFKQRDQQAVERLRQTELQAEEQKARDLGRDRCPRCGERLVKRDRRGVTTDECPAGHGMWLDDGELEQLGERERSSWLGLFYRPKRVV